jgi:hypothetical protein
VVVLELLLEITVILVVREVVVQVQEAELQQAVLEHQGKVLLVVVMLDLLLVHTLQVAVAVQVL